MNQKTPPKLSALPVEVLEMITSNLENGDIKNLRLTSTLGFAIRLHIKRVYLSANPLNIKVLKIIADSDSYRNGVRELIWDDSYLCNTNDLVSANPKKRQSKHDGGFDSIRRCPKWYVRESHRHLESSNYRGGNLFLPDLMQQDMSWEESYAYYYDLAQQQRTVISSNADVKAFSYALDHFPFLSKITISSRAHGRLFVPHYHSPMIRAFPTGFLYPGPVQVHQDQKAQFLWQGDKDGPKKKYTIQRRGLCAALRRLSKHGDHKVSEFIIEDYEKYDRDWMPLDLKTPGHTRDDLATLTKRPDFHTLTLKVDMQSDKWNGLVASEGLVEMRKLFSPILGFPRTWSFHTLTDDRKKNIRWTCSHTPGPDEHARCGAKLY
ncbi:uncharacterized protein FTOL_01377 [Fusarium torulosum]|uniref:F-box domain-containing protein n=1 Tax=Fusarium torulosum TaxID=33205 RepID=A0AAE8M032_9HYPO|nr:uncharacterized protein FTOL_01377 [Fusarium torulosum]